MVVAQRRTFSETVFHCDVDVPRFPCNARKDPMVSEGDLLNISGNWTDHLVHIPTEIAKDFLAIASEMCPHDWLNKAEYHSVILKIDADESTSSMLVSNYSEIFQNFKRNPRDLSRDELNDFLCSVQDSRFFKVMLSKTIFHLYDNPVVWAGCGYEGVEGREPGRRCKDIDDLDWLPDPREIEERQDA